MYVSTDFSKKKEVHGKAIFWPFSRPKCFSSASLQNFFEQAEAEPTPPLWGSRPPTLNTYTKLSSLGKSPLPVSYNYYYYYFEKFDTTHKLRPPPVGGCRSGGVYDYRPWPGVVGTQSLDRGGRVVVVVGQEEEV